VRATEIRRITRAFYGKKDGELDTLIKKVLLNEL